MSNNMDHFPAGYRNQWYFLNVVNPNGANRIKQTATPDNDDGWIITRTGSYDTGNKSYHWNSWLVLDFKNGKLLKTN